VLTGDPATIAAATAGVGYRYAYDAEHDQFAHPAAALVVTAGGRITHALSALSLNGYDLRLALVDAGEGRVGSIGDRLRLLCYGFDPIRGVYTEMITLWLELASVLTLVAMAAAIFLMTAKSRPEAAS
jgi:protein SCO1